MASTITWNNLPPEIRQLLLESFVQNGNRLSHLATVSHGWQNFIESRNFARLKLTPSCLAEFASKTRRNRHVVGYIWFRVELGEYDGVVDDDDDHDDDDDGFGYDLHGYGTEVLSLDDINRVTTAIRDLFAILSTWDSTPSGKLLLDISVYSSSDLEYRSQELTLTPDIPNTCDLSHCLDGILPRMFDNKSEYHINGEFSELYPELKGTFDFEDLFRAIASKDLKKLTVFENFHPSSRAVKEAPEDRQALVHAFSRRTAKASLKLEHFSGSLLVDATDFFASCKSSWQWNNLKSLAITSQALTATGDRYAVENMLQAAAAAVMNMPQLETIEIWNGQPKSASLFRYQPNRGQTNAGLTWRSTWEMAIQPSVTKAWTAVAYKHGARGLHVHKEFLDVRDEVKFHGDAIHYLQLSQPVMRPVSLEQIRQEQEVHARWKEWRRIKRREFMSQMESWTEPENSEYHGIMEYLRAHFNGEEKEDGTG